jgi:NADH-quinone oxidoreductase subunit I
MSEYERHNLVYEKEDLLIKGPGKYPDYNFYAVSGLSFGKKEKDEESLNQKPAVDVDDLML